MATETISILYCKAKSGPVIMYEGIKKEAEINKTKFTEMFKDLEFQITEVSKEQYNSIKDDLDALEKLLTA